MIIREVNFRMNRSDKCNVVKIYISFNCRKLDISDVKRRMFNKINKCLFEKILSLKLVIYLRIKVINFLKIW